MISPENVKEMRPPSARLAHELEVEIDGRLTCAGVDVAWPCIVEVSRRHAEVSGSVMQHYRDAGWKVDFISESGPTRSCVASMVFQEPR